MTGADGEPAHRETQAGLVPVSEKQRYQGVIRGPFLTDIGTAYCSPLIGACREVYAFWFASRLKR